MLQTYGGFERIEQGVLLYLEQSSRQSYSRQATHCLEHPSFPHSPFVLHSPAKWQSFPKWCSPGAIVLFVRISLETLSGDLPIFFAISLSFNCWYMPHSITILSANVKRLIFSCFPQTVTVCILPYPPPTLTERWWKCFAFFTEGDGNSEISVYFSPSKHALQHFHQHPVKVKPTSLVVASSGSENLEISIYTIPFCQGELRVYPVFYLKNRDFTLTI